MNTESASVKPTTTVAEQPVQKPKENSKAEEIIDRLRKNQSIEDNEKKRVKITSNTVIKSSLSIKQKLAPKSEEEQQETTDKINLPKSSFTKEELLIHWKDYSNKLENDGKMVFSNMMRAHEPKLISETEIEFLLDHSSAELEFQDNRTSLATYLKMKLNNFHIQINSRVAEEKEVEKKAYTNRDKLKQLQEENPALAELVKKLDLDSDF